MIYNHWSNQLAPPTYHTHFLVLLDSTVLTEGPEGPGGPGGPRIPCSPRSPWTPGLPGRPVKPLSPFSPASCEKKLLTVKFYIRHARSNDYGSRNSSAQIYINTVLILMEYINARN